MFLKAVASARHAVKHKSLAKFEGSEVFGADKQYEAAAAEFNTYVDGVKDLNKQATAFRSSVVEALGKVGQVTETLVQLSAADGGDLGVNSARVRTVVAHMQAALHHKLIPDLDGVLLSELSAQLTAAKEIQSRIAKRLESVAEANHYTDKVNKLQALPAEKLDQEKLQRNLAKQTESVGRLRNETTDLMKSFDNCNTTRLQFMTGRCAWLRRVVTTFFKEVREAHALLRADIDAEAQLLDLGVERESTTDRLMNHARRFSNFGEAAKQTLAHAAKHKGTILAQGLSGGSNAAGAHDSSGYDAAVERYSGHEADMVALKSSLAAYLQGLEGTLVVLGNVAAAFCALQRAVDDPAHTAGTAQFQTKLGQIMAAFQTDVVGSMADKSVNQLAQQLEQFAPIKQSIATRKQLALDLGHYSSKIAALKDKPAVDHEKLTRNQEKYDAALTSLNGHTDQLMAELATFDEARRRVVASVVAAFEEHHGAWFGHAHAGLYVTGDEEHATNGAAELNGAEQPPLNSPLRKGSFHERRLSRSDTSADPSAPPPPPPGPEAEAEVPVARTGSAEMGDDMRRPSALSCMESTRDISGFGDDQQPEPSAPPQSPLITNTNAPPKLSQQKPRGSVDMREVTGVDQTTYVARESVRRTSFSRSNDSSGQRDSLHMGDAATRQLAQQLLEAEQHNQKKMDQQQAQAQQKRETNGDPDSPQTPPSTATATPDPLPVATPVAAPSAATMLRVRALFDFPGVEAGDLPFKEGDVFDANAQEFQEQGASGGWVNGRTEDGKTGVFPSNYVEAV